MKHKIAPSMMNLISNTSFFIRLQLPTQLGLLKNTVSVNLQGNNLGSGM